MANVKISDLTAASAGALTDQYEINQSGTSKSITAQLLMDMIEANIDVSQFDADATATNTGTSTALVVTPDGLAGSYAGTKAIQVYIPGTLATGDGAAFIPNIPACMNGMNLVSVAAYVETAPTGAALSIMISNTTDAVDVLSTAITIDAGENSTATAATPAVINTSNDDVDTDDLWEIDIDQVGSTVAGADLYVTMEFRLP